MLFNPLYSIYTYRFYQTNMFLDLYLKKVWVSVFYCGFVKLALWFAEKLLIEHATNFKNVLYTTLFTLNVGGFYLHIIPVILVFCY